MRNGRSGGDGGAIKTEGGLTTLKGCTIENCAANKGGGLSLVLGTVLMEEQTSFNGCEAEDGGGAIYMQAGLLELRAGFQVSQCEGGVKGGGVLQDGGKLLAVGATVVACSASSGAGGAIEGGKSYWTQCNVSECIAQTNGGAFLATGGRTFVHIDQCTLRACSAFFRGSAVACFVSRVTVMSSEMSGCNGHVRIPSDLPRMPSPSDLLRMPSPSDLPRHASAQPHMQHQSCSSLSRL